MLSYFGYEEFCDNIHKFCTKKFQPQPSCICISGYVRDKHLNCIPKAKCENFCPDDKEWSECSCQHTCDNWHSDVKSCNCSRGCFCKGDLVLDTETQNCISKGECKRRKYDNV